MKESARVGVTGELAAARYLRDHGYGIEAANYHTRFGEIDIIASKKQYIVFVEVKTRNSSALSTPAEAVTPQKQKKILLSAAQYLHCCPSGLQPRFDVMEVYTKGEGETLCVKTIHHLKNAFDGEDLGESF